MQISTCQPILGLRINCKLITGFKSLTCKLFLGRDSIADNGGKPACRQAGIIAACRWLDSCMLKVNELC